MNRKFVWIGAGSASSPEFSFDNFDSIVLVEARKEAYDELNEYFADDVKVTIKQACISERNEESEFFQCNVEELSALAKPTQLMSLYPGLKVNSFGIDTVSISDFLSEELLDGDIELFIDTPATSWILVRELSKSKFLDSTTMLHVSIGAVPALYEDSADLTELASLLKAKCFEEIYRDSYDPDIPVVSFKLNENLKAIESLKAENSELQQQLIEARLHNEDVEHKSNKLSLELNEKSELIEAKNIEIQALNTDIAKYKTELQKKSLDCDELCNKLDVSKSSTILIENKLAEEQEKVAKFAKEFDEQTSELNDAVQGLNRASDNELKKNIELNDCRSKLEMLTNELSQLRLNNEERERKLEANENKIAELNHQLLSKKAELDKQSESNSELVAINEKVAKERDKANEWCLENKKWAESLVEEKSLLETKLSDCEKKVSSLESNVTALKDDCNTVATKEKNSAITLELNTKLMSKMQLDLDALRVQYKEKVQAEKAMHELITELYSKLKQAQVFYRNLESQFPEIASATKDFD